jgi:hypothetical protein
MPIITMRFLFLCFCVPLESLSGLNEIRGSMTLFLIISVGLITVIAISALIFKLSSIMVEDTPDWSLRDDPSWIPRRDHILEVQPRAGRRRGEDFSATEVVSGRIKLKTATSWTYRPR